jgi:hypothetical protein
MTLTDAGVLTTVGGVSFAGGGLTASYLAGMTVNISSTRGLLLLNGSSANRVHFVPGLTQGSMLLFGDGSINSKAFTNMFWGGANGTNGLIELVVPNAGGTPIWKFENGTNGPADLYVGGAAVVTNGLASMSTVTAVSIAATGWTNIWQTNNAVVYLDTAAAGLAFYVKNNAGTSVYTNASAAIINATVMLQPGGAVVITAGTTPTGRAAPF